MECKTADLIVLRPHVEAGSWQRTGERTYEKDKEVINVLPLARPRFQSPRIRHLLPAGVSAREQRTTRPSANRLSVHLNSNSTQSTSAIAEVSLLTGEFKLQ